MEDFKCWYQSVCTTECKQRFCPRYIEMKYLMDSSGIPVRRQFVKSLSAPECDYPAFCRLAEIKSNIVDFVNNGSSLYINGSITGNGKTEWAIKLLAKYFDEVWAGNGFRPRGLFIHVPTFLLKCKDFDTKDETFEELKRTLSKVDLVVWDDVAGAQLSKFDYAQLLMYVDIRCSESLSNIYTGNLTVREDMEEFLGSRLTSRIWSDSTEIIQFRGGDRR